MGRLKRPLIETVKTLTWLKVAMNAAGVQSAEKLSDVLYMKSKPYNTDIDCTRYENGAQSPGEETLNNIGVSLQNPNIRVAYDLGPPAPTGNSRLWDALVGDTDQLWLVLIDFNPEIRNIQYAGTLSAVMERVIAPFSIRGQGGYRLIANDLIAVAGGREKNSVAHAYEHGLISITNGPIVLDMRFLAALIATWRLCMTYSTQALTMDWIISGLKQQAIKDLAAPFGIAEHLVTMLDDIGQADLERYPGFMTPG